MPPEGLVEKCPPCNPGMEFFNGTCRFCPPNHYSNGANTCTECPGSTAAETGLAVKWWNNLPERANISGSCLSETGEPLFILYETKNCAGI